MSGQIDHIGLISAVDQNKIFVRLVDDPACHTCSMASLCHYNDEDRSLIEIDKNNNKFHVGEEVMVRLKDSSGLLATFFAYLLPFILVVVTLGLFVYLGYSEAVAAIASLIVLVPYYLLVSMFRKKLRQHIQLQIFKR